MTNQEIAHSETEHSCAYCGMKGKENLTIDHIDGKKIPKANSYDNLIVLCRNCHHKKTTGKEITTEYLKKIKKSLIIKTLTKYGVNALTICYRNDFGVVTHPIFLSHMVYMGIIKNRGRKCQQ